MKQNSFLYILVFLLTVLCFQMEAQNRPLNKDKRTTVKKKQKLQNGIVPKKQKSGTDDTLQPKTKPQQKQNNVRQEEERDTSDIIDLKQADEIEGFETETESIRFLKGNVVFYQKDAYFYCDSAYLYEKQNAVLAWGKVTIIQSDTITMFSDSLRYFGETKDAYMIGNVVLTDTSKQIFTERLDYNMETEVATYATGGLLKDGNSQLTSTYGTYNTKTDKAFFRDSVLVINDKFTLKADSLEYDTEAKKSTFLGPTLILQDSAKIYCESGFYDYEKNKAEFRDNPQYISGEKIAVSDRMSYDGTTKKVTLTGHAKFREGEKKARSDVMIYDEEKDITRLEGNAYFKDKEQEVTSDVIIYNGKDESYTTEGKTIAKGKDSYVEANNSSYDKATDITTLTGNVLVADSSQILNAELVQYNNSSGDAYAEGNVHWQDTVNDVSIKSNELFYNKDTEYVKALGRPIMTTIMDGDTLFLSANTLISEEVLADSLDTIKQIVAYRDVRIYKSDFQAVCDSMNYNATDSIFNFFDKPVLWSDSSQFSADTVKIMLKDENIDSIFLLNKALIVDTPDEQFFNQIKGREILIKFVEAQPKKMSVLGNGESVYYIQDDDGGYVGPNKTACSDMYLLFEAGELQFIRFITEPKGKLYPMETTNHNEMKLSGFKWEKSRRPLSPADLGSPYYIGPGMEDFVPIDAQELNTETPAPPKDDIVKKEEKETAEEEKPKTKIKPDFPQENILGKEKKRESRKTNKGRIKRTKRNDE